MDELELVAGDIVYVTHSYDDGWAKAYSIRGEGIVPANYLIPLPTEAHQLPPIPGHLGLTSASAQSITANALQAINANLAAINTTQASSTFQPNGVSSTGNVSGDYDVLGRAYSKSISNPGEGLPRLTSFRTRLDSKDVAKTDSELLAEVR